MARARETHPQTVGRLLAKTVARGCTADEQDAAVGKARELVAKWGLDPTGFEWPPLGVAGPSAKGRTIRAICEEGILAGRTTAQVLEAVRSENGSTRTSPGCVSWYASKMRKAGRLAPRAGPVA